MKNLITLLISFCLTCQAFAQRGESGSAQLSDFNRLNIAVVMPDELDGFNSIHLQKIETKIMSLLTQYSIASGNVDNGIVLYPVISIFNEQKINPGTQTLTVIDSELSLFIKQADDKVVFSSVTKRIKGSGRTREQALNNLISSIPVQSEEYMSFISDARKRIFDYYSKRCPTYLTKANELSKLHKFEQALSLLSSIPSETTCFNQVKGKSVEIFKAYHDYTCSGLLSKAKAKFSANQYADGFSLLSRIDPSSGCAGEVDQLYKRYAKEVDNDTRYYRDLWEKIYKNETEAEKYRWQAITELARNYETRHPRQYNYVLIR